MVAALLIVSAAALSIIGAYLIRTNRPENVIRPVEKESTEMQTLKLLAGLDGAYMYRYTASDDFLSLRIYLTEYHFGKQVRKENWELSYRDIGSPKEGTILIVPDFENFQVKLILADGGSKLSTSFPILEGEENRKYFARAGVSIEDETPITFEAEQPLLALMYFAKQTKKILRGRRSEGFFAAPGSFPRKTPAGGNRALSFPRRSTRESAAAAL